MDEIVTWARGLAQAMLAEEAPARWEHTQGVAQRVRDMRDRLGAEAGLVEAAAWLHCIGYATEIAHTGFYPLDGARYLRDVHAANNVVRELVAHHSGAMVQAQERGLGQELFAEFGPGDEHAFLLDALTACDLTSGNDGSYCRPGDAGTHWAAESAHPAMLRSAHRQLR
jgi:HD superfamily phosphodiesterase